MNVEVEVSMHDSSVPKSAIRISWDAMSGQGGLVPLPMPRALVVLASEVRRAFAAARRYDGLRNGGARREKTADVPRRIFEEFYAAPRKQ
jgi:hypothetical protein